MFDKILIANRGEIACRIIRSARSMGVRTVAVFSEADSGALHVASADEGVFIGAAQASESYLNGAAIIEAAKRTGAQAIHPGYGFLSENADFAEACQAAGITFIGPPTDAIRAMGSKSAAKSIMAAAGVPLVPGYHGDDQDPGLLAAEAKKIGFPVLIKASAGGGGRGMRIVRAANEFAGALESARREARNAFGDERMLIEKYLIQPRHIEIQVFGDVEGNVIHLFERDCSVQRRHQKVIEEAPAPGISDQRRAEIGAAAVAAATAIGYVGAGTVEFIADQSGAFYFMEMNTRLQVEHPVTEMIVGQDLVEWQIRVAAGERLPLEQDDIVLHGHAFEARLYAEDAARDFLPQTGRLAYLSFPAPGRHLRIDTGVRAGDNVSIYYDPMIAKLIVWDRDRPAALRRLRKALAETKIVGVTTNVGFLSAITGHRAFEAGGVDTGFIERHATDLFPAPAQADDETLILALLALLLERKEQAREDARYSPDPYSPWHFRNGWRLNDDSHHVFRLKDGDREIALMVHYRCEGYVIDLPSGPVAAQGAKAPSGEIIADIDGRRISGTVVLDGQEVTVIGPSATHRLTLIDPVTTLADEDSLGGGLVAPMPGKIIQIMVEEGGEVVKGTPLMVLEAMKMEHTIAAPADGIVQQLRFRVGDQVDEGAELIAFAIEEPK